jgi:hypothetical protein
MHGFLERYTSLKLNHEGIETLNRLIMTNEIYSVILLLLKTSIKEKPRRR